MNFPKSEVRSQRSEFDTPSLQHFNASTLQRFNGLSLDLHIDELVLHGFASSDRYAIGDAVERELAQLFRKQGVPNSLRSEKTADEIRGATLNATQHAKPHIIGRQIANAVYQGLGQ